MSTNEDQIEQIQNHDMASFVFKLQYFEAAIFRLHSCSLKIVAEVDQARIVSYITSLRKYLSWIASQPLVDILSINPRFHLKIENPPNVINAHIGCVFSLLHIAKEQALVCESSKMLCGISSFDFNRLDCLLKKAELYMTTHVALDSGVDFS